MSPAGEAHTAFATAAMVFGTWNVVLRKGTPRHKLVGHAYYLTMLGLNGTSFMLYGMFGTFGPFHVLSVISLLTLFAAMVPAILRRPRKTWRRQHGYFMLYSYIGLLAAAAAEAAVRIPPLWPPEHANLYFVLAATISSLVVVGLGALLVPGVLRRNLGSAGMSPGVAEMNS
jgi:uncharacterized membrane protein